MGAIKSPPVGSLLIARKVKDTTNLTLGKVYILKKITSTNHYSVINDLGEYCNYYSYRFEIVDSKALKVLYGGTNE